VEALAVTGAVLVVLDGHKRRLGLAVEAGDDPRLGVGLLEVVQGPVGDVLPKLPTLALANEEVGRAVAVSGLDQQGVYGKVDIVSPADVRPEGLKEWLLQVTAEPQDIVVPLQVVVDAGKPPVVQLVGHIQGELEILAIRVGGFGQGKRASRRTTIQDGDEIGGEGATRARKSDDGMVPAGRAVYPSIKAGDDMGMRLEVMKAQLGAPTAADKEHLTTAQLKELAREQEIPGRSSMSRDEQVATVATA